MPAQCQALFSGEPLNVQEGRAALHTALRWPADKPPIPGSEAACQFAQQELDRMAALVTLSKKAEAIWGRNDEDD